MSEEESTTPDLVQLTRDWLEAGTSGDLDRTLSFLGPDPVWDMSPMGMGVFEGLVAVRGFYIDWMGAYEDYRIEPEEIHDLGNGVTFGIVVQEGRPMGSLGKVQLRYGTCAQWVDDKAVRVWNYSDIDEARAAAERLAQDRGKAMSQATVELVRNGIAAWNQRDADLWLSNAAPEIEWLPAGPATVDSTVYRGYEECARGFAAVWETWAVFEFQEHEVRDLGNSVLWLGRVKMQGSASGVELDQEFAAHSVVSDGKFIRVQTFLSWREALEAVGLEG